MPRAASLSHITPSALLMRLAAGLALLSSTLIVPQAAMSADTGPPTILYAGEVANAPSYDHVILIYDERLDESEDPSAANFSVEINGVPHPADDATFLLSGLPNLGEPFDPGGATFLRLDLPADVTIGPATTSLHVTYTPGLGPNPIRDLSRTEAQLDTVEGELFETGSFDYLAAIVDGDHGADRVALVFTGQIDLSSILPPPSEFAVTITPSGGGASAPATVTGVQAIHPDVGLGILDLVLASPIKYDDSVEVFYTEGTPIKSKNEPGVTAGDFSGPVTVLLPINVATGDVSATTATGGFPTAADPVATTVTSPSGGPVSIVEMPFAAPPGSLYFGEQVVITAPDALGPATPLVLRFEIDASLIPLGQTHLSVVVLRNNVPIPECTGPTGWADPTPCVSVREPLPGGDIGITVLTVQASDYNFAIVAPYAFAGFKWPVDNPPAHNRVIAGLPVPLRFSLGGDQGLGIFNAGYPASGRVNCNFATPPATLQQTVTSLGLPLHYSSRNDTYLYLWRTDRAWRGTCRTLVISFADGSSVQAFFDFRR